MKKTKKRILIVFASILSVVLIYGVLFIFNFFQGWTTVKNGEVSSYVTPLKNEFTSNYVAKLNFDSQPISEVSNVNISYCHKPIALTNSILLKAQRYYFSVTDICNMLGYSNNYANNILTLSSTQNIILENNKATINNEIYDLRGKLIIENNIPYISISDVEYLFDLVASYDFQQSTIDFVKKESTSVDKSNSDVEKKVALIRLEDFSAGDAFSSNTNILRFKAMGDLLYKNNMKFHIAWVPRFKAPRDNIDNDLLANQSLENIAFVNILDYLINSGGLIGAHGYTHQANDERSLNGTELSRKANSSEEETREVIENAIDTASALNIPIGFFESPHYQATSSQKKIIEEYFQYIYEPKNPLIYHSLKQTDKGNFYIPTPLSYVKNLNTNSIVKNLEDPRYGLLASVFYHPSLELEFIEPDVSGDYFKVDYDINSPLNNIIRGMKENNYETIYVSQFK
ncbi:MAG: DUF2334 domain-containing protein [Clostridium sp.]